MEFPKEYDLVCSDPDCEYSGEKGESGLTAKSQEWYCPACRKKMVPRKK